MKANEPVCFHRHTGLRLNEVPHPICDECVALSLPAHLSDSFICCRCGGLQLRDPANKPVKNYRRGSSECDIFPIHLRQVCHVAGTR